MLVLPCTIPCFVSSLHVPVPLLEAVNLIKWVKTNQEAATRSRDTNTLVLPRPPLVLFYVLDLEVQLYIESSSSLCIHRVLL